ncbi:patatin-like phospholipase family protein, partial [Burkholderia gladioli]|nr:patatin-like phospholipase family protein [Burkholderia gladioli]
LAIAPSERIELIAAKHLRRLPATVRALLGAMGGNQPAGASFASYLLFEAEFTRELIALGHADAMRQRETLAEWIASASPGGGSPPPVSPVVRPATAPGAIAEPAHGGAASELPMPAPASGAAAARPAPLSSEPGVGSISEPNRPD